MLERLGSQRLGDAGRLALDHRTRRLGRDVVGREAGAAGREDERDALADVAAQRRLDPPLVVADDVARDDLAAGLGRELREQVARDVVALSARERRGDRQDGRLHGGELSPFGAASLWRVPPTGAASC